MSIDVTQIRSVDWSRQVGSFGAIVEQLDDIAQCIRIILATPKGAVEHRPEFGCDARKYLDHPTNQALPHIIRECTDALEQWEPRAKVSSITPNYAGAQVYLTITWKATLGSGGQTTEVSYDLTRPQ